jgi:hypothetical protein
MSIKQFFPIFRGTLTKPNISETPFYRNHRTERKKGKEKKKKRMKKKEKKRKKERKKTVPAMEEIMLTVINMFSVLLLFSSSPQIRKDFVPVACSLLYVTNIVCHFPSLCQIPGSVYMLCTSVH